MLALGAHVARRIDAYGERPRAAALKALHCLLAEIRRERGERIPHSEEAFEHFRALHDLAATHPG